jgi:hypothetical protein
VDFKGLIKCANCGKNFKKRLERKRLMYCCGGWANYGKEFCFYNPISHDELLETIAKHFALLGKRIDGEIGEYVKRIEVDRGKYKIYYVDKTISIVDITDDFGVKIKY